MSSSLQSFISYVNLDEKYKFSNVRNNILDYANEKQIYSQRITGYYHQIIQESIVKFKKTLILLKESSCDERIIKDLERILLLGLKYDRCVKTYTLVRSTKLKHILEGSRSYSSTHLATYVELYVSSELCFASTTRRKIMYVNPI